MPSAAQNRRLPTQRRARQTVEAILDAVLRILKREGVAAVTTNRIAEVAGVSIGTLYQYFPDKTAIFAALHRRHVDQVDTLLQTALIAHASSSLEDLIRALIDTMVDAHTADPELHDLLMTQVPHRAGDTQDFALRLHPLFRVAIASKFDELKSSRDLDTAAFIVTHLVESLSHGAAFRRPSSLSLDDAKYEATLAVLAYLWS